MLLPTAKTPPKASLSDYTVLVHSRPKAGKSEFCSHADNALFLATEPGLNALEVYQVPITSWDDFLAACGEIAEGNHPFKTIVIDTVDLAYRMCSEYICRKFKIEHESDMVLARRGHSYPASSSECSPSSLTCPTVSS
jgi:hypothetical protein